MPTIEVRQELSSPIGAIWKEICDVANYPRLMPPVRRLTTISRNGPTLVTEWEVELKGSILCWTQTEHHDDENFRVTYRQIDGDLERFDGAWQLERLPGNRTLATLGIDFEIGIPMLAEMLNPVAERALRENSISMLQALDRKLS